MWKYIACAFAVSLACFLPLAAGDLYHVRGNVAMVDFECWDDAGFVTIVWMQVDEYRAQNPPGNGTKGAEIIFQAYRYNPMTYEVVFDGYGYQELPPGVFEIDGRLNHATLSTELVFYDWVSGNPLTFTIDITVTAVGPSMRETNHQQLNGPNFKVNYKWTGVSRDAEGAGTVFLNGENLTPNASYYGRLMNVKSMQVTVE